MTQMCHLKNHITRVHNILAKDLQKMELNDFKIESPKLNKQNHHLEQGNEDEKHTERQEEDKEEEGYTSKDHNHEEQEKTKETTVTSDLESEESKE